MHPRRLPALAVLLAIACAGTGSGDGGTATGDTGAASECVALADLCLRITSEEVAAIIGTEIDTATPLDSETGSGPVNGCNYSDGPLPQVALSRNCFTSGPEAAQAFYRMQKDGPATGAGETVVEIEGLGEEAHLRTVPDGDNASLYVLDGDRVQLARRFAIAGLTAQQREDHLRALAEAMLALD